MDLQSLFATAQELPHSTPNVARGLKKLAKACIEQGAAIDLAAVAKLPIAKELKRLEQWFGSLWTPKPPQKRANASYFGIAEFDGGRHDFRCLALHGKDPSTEDWDFAGGKVTEPEFAGSEVLAALSAKKGPLATSSEARHILLLGYVALVAAHLVRTRAAELATRKLLVAAGYDEGDFILLGRSKLDGSFERTSAEPPPATKPVKLPTNVELFQLKDTKTRGGGWMLDGPFLGTKELLGGFATSAKRIKPAPYVATIKLRGKPLDISFTLIDALVVRRAIGELFSRLDPRSIQRVPIVVEGSSEPFEILNVIASVPPKQIKASARGRKTCEGSLGEPKIARSGVALIRVVVGREIAEALARLNVTGAELVPLDKADLD
jgi:hypothetical protein